MPKRAWPEMEKAILKGLVGEQLLADKATGRVGGGLTAKKTLAEKRAGKGEIKMFFREARHRQ